MMQGQKVHVSESFAGMVQHYMSSVINVISMTAKYGEGLTPAQMVLYYKVDKHYQEEDPRSVAMYIALFAREFPLVDVPDGVKFKAKSMGIVANREKGVGYLHADGTYHYFDVKGKEVKAMEKKCACGHPAHAQLGSYCKECFLNVAIDDANGGDYYTVMGQVILRDGTRTDVFVE